MSARRMRLISISNSVMKNKSVSTENFQEVFPTVIPLYHVFGYNVVMHGNIIYGGKNVTLEKFTPNSYIKMLQEYPNSTVLCLVPPLGELSLLLKFTGSVLIDYLNHSERPQKSLDKGST